MVHAHVDGPTALAGVEAERLVLISMPCCVPTGVDARRDCGGINFRGWPEQIRPRRAQLSPLFCLTTLRTMRSTMPGAMSCSQRPSLSYPCRPNLIHLIRESGLQKKAG